MTAIGSMYGKALYLLACENGECEETLSLLHAVRAILEENPAYIALLDSPAVPVQERLDAAGAAFAEIGETVRNLLCLLTEKRHMKYFGAAVREFERTYDRDNGILKVTAITAVPLSDRQKEAIAANLTAEIPGTRRVVIENRLDPGILGGLILQYAGKQTDASLSLQLETLREKIASASLTPH